MTDRPGRSPFRESAVLVLLRGHGDALETFWVRRGDEMAVQPGFHAFLGGKVDAQDAGLEVIGAANDFERAARACGIREAFEEAGVLVGLEGAADLAGLDQARADLVAGRVTFPELARERGWRFRADALVPAGRWTTPPFAHARFDACYYLARVPEGQTLSVQPGEIAHGEWVKPLAALDRYRHGDAIFAAPILWTLVALAEGEEGLIERLARGPERSREPVPRIELTWGVVLHASPTRPLPPATHTNAYLIGERDLALLDPGSGDPEALRELFALVDHLAGEGRRLKMILVSHHHPDHVGGVAALRERYHVPVAAHALAARHLAIDVALRDGERLPLLPGYRDWTLRVLHTPGHARDHLCFLHEASGSLFCGDHIPGAGTVIVDPPEGDMRDYLESLERLAALEPRTLYPGHGLPQGAAVRRIRALLAHRLEREARVIAALGAEPRSTAALLPATYADVKPDLWPYAERSLLAHLLKLEAEGRAVREGELWRRA